MFIEKREPGIPVLLIGAKRSLYARRQGRCDNPRESHQAGEDGLVFRRQRNPAALLAQRQPIEDLQPRHSHDLAGTTARLRLSGQGKDRTQLLQRLSVQHPQPAFGIDHPSLLEGGPPLCLGQHYTVAPDFRADFKPIDPAPFRLDTLHLRGAFPSGGLERLILVQQFDPGRREPV